MNKQPQQKYEMRTCAKCKPPCIFLADRYPRLDKFGCFVRSYPFDAVQFAQVQLIGQDAYLIRVFQCATLSEPCMWLSCKKITHQFIQRVTFHIEPKFNADTDEIEELVHTQEESLFIICPECLEQIVALSHTLTKEGGYSPNLTMIWEE